MTFVWNTNTNLLRSATVGGVTETYRQDFFGRAATREPATTTPVDHYVYDDIEGLNVIGVRRWVGLTDRSARRVLQKLDNYLYDGVDHPLRLQHRLQVDDTTFQTVYFEVDLAGNVRRLRGAAGEDLGGYRYTAFGKAYPADATTPAAQVDQPLRWKGRWFNAATGLYDVRARQWSPELGVFISADEFRLLRDDSTLWGWPGQNPLVWRDPAGQCPQCLVAAAGATVGAVTNLLYFVSTAPLSQVETLSGLSGAIVNGAISGTTAAIGIPEAFAGGIVASIVGNEISGQEITATDALLSGAGNAFGAYLGGTVQGNVHFSTEGVLTSQAVKETAMELQAEAMTQLEPLLGTLSANFGKDEIEALLQKKTTDDSGKKADPCAK